MSLLAKELAGYDLYHLVSCFFLFSVIGWTVESIYMSFCNRRMTNRGFMRGPFCPIYGTGAVLGYLILHPLSGNIVVLYLVGAVLATIFEFLVAELMMQLFGEVWWDYREKPFNYKGVICLESTIAWGLYAVIIINILFKKVMNMVDAVPFHYGIRLLVVVFLIVSYDFGQQYIHYRKQNNQSA